MKVTFKKIELPMPGYRIIKTSIAIFLTLILYHFFFKEFTALACIAVIICMQDSVSKSFKDGLNRVFGTIMGGIFGIAFISVNYPNFLIKSTVCTVFVSIIIYVGVLLNRKEIISISCVVFLVIATNTGLEMPLMYSVMRVVHTIIGIVIALLVNKFIFPPKDTNVTLKANVKIPYIEKK